MKLYLTSKCIQNLQQIIITIKIKFQIYLNIMQIVTKLLKFLPS